MSSVSERELSLKMGNLLCRTHRARHGPYFIRTVAPQKSETALIHRYFLPWFYRIKTPPMDRDSQDDGTLAYFRKVGMEAVNKSGLSYVLVGPNREFVPVALHNRETSSS